MTAYEFLTKLTSPDSLMVMALGWVFGTLFLFSSSIAIPGQTPDPIGSGIAALIAVLIGQTLNVLDGLVE